MCPMNHCTFGLEFLETGITQDLWHWHLARYKLVYYYYYYYYYISVKSCLSNVHSCFLQHLTSNGRNWVLQLRRFRHVQRWLVMPLTLHRHHLLPLWLPVAWELYCQSTAAVDLLHCPLSGKSLVYIISLPLVSLQVVFIMFYSCCATVAWNKIIVNSKYL